MPTTTMKLSVTLAVLISPVVLVDKNSCASDPPRSQDVMNLVAEWRQRENNIRSVRCQIGGLLRTSRELESDSVIVDEAYERTVAFDGFDGRRMFAQSTRPIRVADTGYLEVNEFRQSTNEDQGRILSEMKNMEFPVGYIVPTDVSVRFRDIEFKPLVLFCRALNLSMGGISKEQLVETATSGYIDQHKCAIIGVRDANNTPPLRQLWVDLDDKMVVRRYVSSYRSGTIRHQLDVEYIDDSNFGLVPHKWRFVANYENGDHKETVEEHVVKLEINPTLSKADFIIDFPAGTMVIDERTPRRLTGTVGENGLLTSLSPKAARDKWREGSAKVFPSNELESQGRAGFLTLFVVAIVLPAVLFVAYHFGKRLLRGGAV